MNPRYTRLIYLSIYLLDTTLVPYLEAILNGQSNRDRNHHFYETAAKQAATQPNMVGRLIEQADLGEL